MSENERFYTKRPRKHLFGALGVFDLLHNVYNMDVLHLVKITKIFRRKYWLLTTDDFCRIISKYEKKNTQ